MWILLPIAFVGFLYVLIMFFSYDPLKKYSKEFNLKKAGMEYSADISALSLIVFAERGSALKKKEATIWVTTSEKYRIFISAERISKDLRLATFANEASNYHFVLDSKDNNGPIVSNLKRVGKLPAKNHELEGHFQDRFDVYCGKDQERDLLEVLTPDVMLNIFDNLNQFDLEIIKGQVAMNIRKGAESASTFSRALEDFRKLEKLVKATSKVRSG